MQPGDEVVEYDGQPVRFAFLLDQVLKAPQPFRPAVSLVLRRAGTEVKVNVPSGDLGVTIEDAAVGFSPPKAD